MSHTTRRKIEREVIRAFIAQAIREGYHVSVNNGAEKESKRYSDPDACLRRLFRCDSEHLFIYPKDAADRLGWVFLVYGNNGWDVINDYTTNLEHLMTDANAVSNKYDS